MMSIRPLSSARTLSLVLISTLLAFAGGAGAIDAIRPAAKMPLAAKAVFLGLSLAGERIVAAGERGIVIYSDDGGKNWTQADVPVDRTLTSVHFVDARRGWAVGHHEIILRSENAGASWTIEHADADSENVYLKVWFADDALGWVLGANGQLLVTRDGGKRWERTTLAVEDWYQNHLFGISRLADGTTLVAAEKGVLYRSADGLSDWQPLASPYEGSYFGALALPGDRFLIYGMSGRIYLSADRGESWRRIASGTKQFLFDAAPLPDGRVLIVGKGGTLVVVDPAGEAGPARQRPDRGGLTAVLPLGKEVALAREAGGVVVVAGTEVGL